jgi:hypothetical protein
MIGFPDSFMVAVTPRGHALCLGNRSTVDSPASQKSLSRLTKATAAHQAARKHADKFPDQGGDPVRSDYPRDVLAGMASVTHSHS